MTIARVPESQPWFLCVQLLCKRRAHKKLRKVQRVKHKQLFSVPGSVRVFRRERRKGSNSTCSEFTISLKPHQDEGIEEIRTARSTFPIVFGHVPRVAQVIRCERDANLPRIYHMRLSRKAIEIVIMSNQNSCPPTLNDASPEKGREAPATSPTLTTLTQKKREGEREKERRLRGNTCREERSTFPIVFVP